MKIEIGDNIISLDNFIQIELLPNASNEYILHITYVGGKQLQIILGDYKKGRERFNKIKEFFPDMLKVE